MFVSHFPHLPSATSHTDLSGSIQGITIPLTKAAPLAIVRTKSVMSSAPFTGFFAKFRAYFSAPVTLEGDEITSTTHKKLSSIAHPTTSSADPSTPSRGVSRRNSVDGGTTTPPQAEREMEEVAKADLDVAEAKGEMNVDGTMREMREENLEKAEKRLQMAERDVTERDSPLATGQNTPTGAAGGSRVEFALPPRT